MLIESFRARLIKRNDFPFCNRAAKRLLEKRIFVQVFVDNIGREAGDEQQKEQDAAPLPDQPLHAQHRRVIVFNAVRVAHSRDATRARRWRRLRRHLARRVHNAVAHP